MPRGRVLKDDLVADIAIQAPTSIERLASLRSLPKGFERSAWGAGNPGSRQARARARSEDAAGDRTRQDVAEWHRPSSNC